MFGHHLIAPIVKLQLFKQWTIKKLICILIIELKLTSKIPRKITTKVNIKKKYTHQLATKNFFKKNEVKKEKYPEMPITM